MWNALHEWIEKLDNMESDESKQFLAEEFGPLPRISLMVPDFSRPYLVLVHGLFVISISFVHSVLLVYSTFLVRDDFNSFMYLAHFTILYVFSLVIFAHINMNRQNICNMMHQSQKGLYEYNVEENPNLPYIKKRLRKEKNLLISLGVVIAVVALCLLGTPKIDEFLGVGQNSSYSDNGVNMKTLFPTYYPFPTHEGFLYFMALGGQFITVIEVSLIFTTASLLYVIGAIQLIIHINELILSMRDLEKRTVKYYMKKRGRFPTPDTRPNSCYEECLEFCLGENISHHKLIQRMCNDFNKIAGVPVGCGLIVGTIVIALSLIKLAENKNDDFTAQTITFGVSVMAEVLNMYLLSYFGELVLTASEELYYEVYFMNWRNFHVKARKALVMFLQGSKTPLQIKAGSVVCNMQMFYKVMNTSYSCFNMLNLGKRLEELRVRYRRRRTLNKKLAAIRNKLRKKYGKPQKT